MSEYKYFNLSSDKKKELTKIIKETLQSRPEVDFAYLYGSFTDKEERPVRDIDIAVYVNTEKAKEDILQYTTDLMLQIRERGVLVPLDIYVINDVPLTLLHHILANGKILFYRDEDFLTDLIEKTTYRYFEALPFIENYLKEIRS